MTEKFSNGLSDAQAERLAVLVEELGEAIQCAGKLLRHGSDNGFDREYNEGGATNWEALEREAGHVHAALALLYRTRDLDAGRVTGHYRDKCATRAKWLHHQEEA